MEKDAHPRFQDWLKSRLPASTTQLIRQAVPEFAAAYTAIAKRRGRKIATIAISRKLLTRAYHLLAGLQDTGTTAPPRRP